ncbi:glycine cleavage system protein GcvH [Kitasatospora sp. MBT63]|uniref:glycine cleavage system protein GcvH n=1 Tax=Kitasatospora sp. MBT63 TaxID=1444768 RepID=UPI00053A3C9F|nr:glycine cleavage system protein GcvH [Kitasatospora sp. MBT63]
MANVPDDLKYSKDHEWVRSLGKGQVQVGITDHAQRQLGDIVYVELPKTGDRLDQYEPFGSVESVKAVSEIFMPLTGRISAVNESLNDEPEQVNTDPFGDGWLVQVELSDPKALDGLLTAAEYRDFIQQDSSD